MKRLLGRADAAENLISIELHMRGTLKMNLSEKLLLIEKRNDLDGDEQIQYLLNLVDSLRTILADLDSGIDFTINEDGTFSYTY